MCLPGPTMKSYLFSVQTLCPLAQTIVFKHTELPARQQEPAVWRLWAIRGEKKKKKKRKRVRAAARGNGLRTDLSARRSAWKALSEITSRHSWCEGGETADVNVVLTDWAMCTMSVITGSARWQDCSANLRGDRSGWSRAEIRRSVDELKNYGGEWQCVNTLSWAATIEKKLNRIRCWFHTETGSNIVFATSSQRDPGDPATVPDNSNNGLGLYSVFMTHGNHYSFTPHSCWRLGLGTKLRCICGTDWNVWCKNFNIKVSKISKDAGDWFSHYSGVN